MLIALLVGWTFLGFTTQVVCVVLGGVGFGPPLLRSEVTMLNALVDFATEGFAALANLGKGLFALAVLSYQLNLRIVEAEQGDGSVLVGVSAARPAGTR